MLTAHNASGLITSQQAGATPESGVAGSWADGGTERDEPSSASSPWVDDPEDEPRVASCRAPLSASICCKAAAAPVNSQFVLHMCLRV